jgi:hypothetical protein
MAVELPKDQDADFISNLPKFPSEARDLPDTADTQVRRTRRWFSVGVVLGAAFGLTCAIPEAPAWIRLPGMIVALVFARIPGVPNWVFAWVCPIIGWGVIGGLVGWAIDDYRERRERHNERSRR